MGVMPAIRVTGLILPLIGVFASGCGPTYTPVPNAKYPVAVIKGRAPRQGFLGASFATVTATAREVFPGGGAAAAGMRTGDRVLSVAGQTVNNTPSILRATRGTRPGDEVTVVVERDRSQLPLLVRLMSFADVIVLSEQYRSGQPDH